MHLLNKRRPRRLQGSTARAHVLPARWLRRRRRGAPPVAGRCGRCSGSRSFSPGRRATLPHACDPDAGRERAATPRRRWRQPEKPGLEPGLLRAYFCLPPPRRGRARARHCNFISFLARPASALPKSSSPPDSRNWESA